MDIEYIRQNYDCDYASGDVYKILKGGVRKKSGALCNGYLRTLVKGKMIYNHRIVWAHYYKSDPPAFIDHINNKRTDNSITNLRPSSPSHNQMNRCLSRNNTTGYTGVTYIKRLRKYKATIYIKNYPKHLGVYDTAKEASLAYITAKEIEEQRRREMV